MHFAFKILTRAFFIFSFVVLALETRVQAQDFSLDQFFELPEVKEFEEKDEVLAPSFIVLDEEEENEIVYINADGKNGMNAPPAILFGSTPRSGSSGSSGGHITIVVKRLPKKVLVQARGGDGGDGGRGANGLKGRSGSDGRNARLFRKASEGKDGENGGNAGDGSHGGHGGNGGKVRILFVPDETTDFEEDWISRFEVDVSGGQGGQEGLAGVGGAGGEAGRGGKKFWSSKRESSGKPGFPGKSGRPGKPGAEGREGSVEFTEVENFSEWILGEYEDFSGL